MWLIYLVNFTYKFLERKRTASITIFWLQTQDKKIPTQASGRPLSQFLSDEFLKTPLRGCQDVNSAHASVFWIQTVWKSHHNSALFSQTSLGSSWRPYPVPVAVCFPQASRPLTGSRHNEADNADRKRRDVSAPDVSVAEVFSLAVSWLGAAVYGEDRKTLTKLPPIVWKV